MQSIMVRAERQRTNRDARLKKSSSICFSAILVSLPGTAILVSRPMIVLLVSLSVIAALVSSPRDPSPAFVPFPILIAVIGAKSRALTLLKPVP